VGRTLLRGDGVEPDYKTDTQLRSPTGGMTDLSHTSNGPDRLAGGQKSAF